MDHQHFHSDETVPVKPEIVKHAHVRRDQYEAWYAQSVKDPEGFWAEQAERLQWHKRWDRVKDTSFEKPVHIRWFEGGKLNVSENCIDRHLPHRADQTAIIWEGDDASEQRRITYGELHREVCRMANVLKSLGVKKGDRVTIYMPMIPEAAYAMLACTRIGAVHSVVFGGFSSESLKGRIEDCDSNVIITTDEGLRGGKKVPLKASVDHAIEHLDGVRHVLVIKRTGGAIAMKQGRDIYYDEAVQGVSDQCPPESMDSEDPLFILYTSGSTGKPKGVLHTTGGYLLYAAMTHEMVFDYQPGEIYWCTADVGWVTGHSYVVYGPLCNGAITLMFEGVPSYPDPGRVWEVVARHKVNILYTAPTLVRALMREGDEWVTKHERRSLRIIGSVGEPINSEAWLWLYHIAGEGRCPIVDTWWQTETGGHMIAPLPGAFTLKPSSATLPFFGVQPTLLAEPGKVISGEGEGALCIADSWPGQARTVYGDHDRFYMTYFSQYPGYYFSGDGAKRDKDGYYWITGRIDDVINVSGHRFGTAEIESAINTHDAVAESAVVGFPHDIKGQGIYAYVILNAGEIETPDLKKQLVQQVRTEIGPIASPDVIQIVSGLPKTRSGKIMRRILRKVAENEIGSLGDISTLMNPEVVDEIVQGREKAGVN